MAYTPLPNYKHHATTHSTPIFFIITKKPRPQNTKVMVTVDSSPDDTGTYHFFIEIPPGPRDAVSIFEDFDFEGDVNQREITECRALVARELWTAIRDEARRDFNLRLKEKKHKPGTWNAGKTKLDRFLGKEICVLAWAAEHASPDECPILCQK